MKKKKGEKPSFFDNMDGVHVDGDFLPGSNIACLIFKDNGEYKYLKSKYNLLKREIEKESEGTVSFLDN